MKFPFVVEKSLTDAQRHRYAHHIDSDESGWHRRFTESIWRRHQDPSNARLSGWKSPDDRRRRIIHFYDEYGLEGRDFVLRHPYLYLSLTLTDDAIAAYEARIRAGLDQGGWSRREQGAADGGGHRETYRRGDLEAVITTWAVHPEDAKRNNAPPAHYRSLDLRLRTVDKPVPEGWAERPWKVFFDVGLREKLPRGNPRIVEPEELCSFFPAQVELGCGPSIEAGIPHLSTLHRIYGVSHGDYGFVFRAEDDAALEVLFEPERKYAEMTEIYRACLVAQPTSFYRTLVKLYAAGHLVGPVITNNFDCQCADLGLPERSLRKYDWGPYYPEIQHPPEAKSVLVIGVHADRRLVQMRARRRGLKILHIDPERYIAPDGSHIPYPVEAPQDEDLFARATAEEAFERIGALLLRLSPLRQVNRAARGAARDAYVRSRGS